MKTNKNLITAIKNNDVIAGQSAILVHFRKDRNAINYKNVEFVEYAKKEFEKLGKKFFDHDDGESEFTSDNNMWNVELWENMRVEIKYNFSEKKFNDIINLMKHLRETGHPDFQVKTELVVSKNKDEQAPKSSFQQTKKHSPYLSKNIQGALVGGAIGAVGITILGAVISGVQGVSAGVLIGRPIIGSLIGAGIGFALNKQSK